MKATTSKLETRRILIFIGITFLVTCVYCFCVVYPLNNSVDAFQNMDILKTLLMTAVMFFPAIGVLLTRLLTKEGFKNAWLRPHFKGNIGTYLLAYFGPGVLTVLGAVIYFLLFPESFDPELGYLRSTLEAAGVDADTSPVSPSSVILSQMLTALFLGPIMNFVTCFGEEWGWRGYLLPKMAEKLPTVPMLLVNGIIWGLWHAPLTAIGHNYGVGYWGFPYTGIAAMCLFCIIMGVFLSYVSMKTKSCIPAVLAHGAINSIGAIGLYFTADGGNRFVGPAPFGIVGAIPFIAAAVIMLVLSFKACGKND